MLYSCASTGFKLAKFDRSGRITIWPYIMRELPLSPVAALRLELVYKERQRPSIDAGVSKGTTKCRKGVEFLPARLTRDKDRSTELDIELEPGPHAGSDLEALKGKLLSVQHGKQDMFISKTGSTPVFEDGKIGSILTPWKESSGNNGWTCPVTVKRSADRRLQYNDRPASSGARRRRTPTVSCYLRSLTGDHTECPFGCGEEIRVQDLAQHQASLCSWR